MDIRTHEIRNVTITPEILKFIAEIVEFKGRWKVMESLAGWYKETAKCSLPP